MQKEHRLNLYISSETAGKIQKIVEVTGLKKAQLWGQFVDMFLEEFVDRYTKRILTTGKDFLLENLKGEKPHA